jgi:hypothetical protein
MIGFTLKPRVGSKPLTPASFVLPLDKPTLNFETRLYLRFIRVHLCNLWLSNFPLPFSSLVPVGANTRWLTL